jgi:YbgC/YbaW family acyl-CoA thioester hydrolase
MILGNTHVHYADVTSDLLDAGNALYHANYFVLSDRARGGVFEGVGYPLHELWEDGYSLLVREVTSEFLKPVPAGAKLAILSQVTVHSERSLTVSQQFASRHDLPKIDLNGSFVDETNLVDPKAILCRLQTKLVCANIRERRDVLLPTPLANAFRQLANARGGRAHRAHHALCAGVSS